MSAWTETAIRPDGRTYRAKVKPHAETFCDYQGDPCGIVICRTHDMDVATALAQREIRATDWGLTLEPGSRGWWHLAPFGGPDGPAWQDDPKRGIPVIHFRFSE